MQQVAFCTVRVDTFVAICSNRYYKTIRHYACSCNLTIKSVKNSSLYVVLFMIRVEFVSCIKGDIKLPFPLL